MIDIKTAKKIAKPYIGIELWFDKRQRLWTLSDRKLEASSDWIASRHLKDFEPEEWQSRVEEYAIHVADYHGAETLSDTGELADTTCGIDPPFIIECSEVHKARARGLL